jgi:branched-chain amino acid transport system permease protein
MANSIAQTVKAGLVGGAVVLLMSLIGMIEAFNKREIVGGVIGLGTALLYGVMVFTGFLMVRSRRKQAPSTLSTDAQHGAVAGVLCALVPAVLVLLNQVVTVSAVFINVNPELMKVLTFQQDTLGVVILLSVGAALGAGGAALHWLPTRGRHALTLTLIWVAALGVLQELIRVTFSHLAALSEFIKLLYTDNGLTIVAAIGIALVVFALDMAWGPTRDRLRARLALLPTTTQTTLRWAGVGLGFFLLVFIPWFLNDIYIAEVMNQVGLYVLMGLGLNLVVGFAGLLDLGYVAFFAIGAYMVGVLTSVEKIGVLNWWLALPVAVVMAVLFGFVLGIPVLKIRGDYLAIVTMGFGEIIRILAGSDFLAKFLGGSQGIAGIPKASIFTFLFNDPIKLYYLILTACLLAIFLARRLKDSRVGRAWMAVREDEDVAQAMGIDLIWAKLMAFGIGASFAGVSGAIFATKLAIIYPHSFKLDISINVLALLIIGGMGSIPGVIIGALVLVGLPELFREFEDFRILVYGATLVLMMQLRPEGLWPEATRQRELHAHGEPNLHETEAELQKG